MSGVEWKNEQIFAILFHWTQATKKRSGTMAPWKWPYECEWVGGGMRGERDG